MAVLSRVPLRAPVRFPLRVFLEEVYKARVLQGFFRVRAEGLGFRASLGFKYLGIEVARPTGVPSESTLCGVFRFWRVLPISGGLQRAIPSKIMAMPSVAYHRYHASAKDLIVRYFRLRPALHSIANPNP